ncbi:hypothetical protein CAC42_3115 [Sphaceloma murrayae]|uniref:Cyclin-domain-containing protein n=1 Tax=Sphaceloma murrayae TaxID=2082308 RepID=A0A2K1QS06_9PEZI|nr:hypothetical protein CAC42_3115 [Sphaceloma murrayae]
MAVVADSVNHLFTPPHQPGEFPDYRSSSRATSTRSGRSTPHNDRVRDVAHSFVPMSRSSGSQQSYHSQNEDSTPRGAQDAAGSGPSTETARRSAGAPAESVTAGSRSTDAMDTTTHHDTRESNISMSSSTVSLPAPLPSPSSASPQKVQVRDLSHIQTLASSRPGSALSSRAGSRRDINVQYEISSMPIEHIIEMVAGLLTKITTTNDMQHEHLHRQMPPPDSSASISPQTSSVLAFHGKNVPSITILSYLNRINKYCPTSYEVFLSLLVYFDRMTEKVNSGPIQSLREQDHGRTKERGQMEDEADTGKVKEPEAAQTVTPPASGNLDTAEQGGAIPGTPHSRFQDSPPIAGGSTHDTDPNLSHFFVVDSFNIHRLVIAGVTCASKFFSDIFYTNSRYAKVGGLPLPELNHLELQFLLLNDFRLSIPVEELEAYGTMLVEFYAREVVDAERNTSMQTDTA